MAEEYKGLMYPMAVDPRGFFYPTSGSNSIRASLLSILLTDKGERIMENDFGADLSRLIFEPATSALIQSAKSKISAAIAQYEPRISIEDLTVSLTPPNDFAIDSSDRNSNQILYIRIKYVEPEKPLETQDLNLELPLSGGQVEGSIS